MPRKPLPLLNLDRRSKMPLQDQLANALKHQILKGAISPGRPLPSSREIARELRVSRNTVVAACDRLLGEGYLEAIPRSGLFVAQQLTTSGAQRASQSASRHKAQAHPKFNPLAEPIPFRPCRPDVRLFPLARWNRHRTSALKKYGSALFQYQPSCTLGLPALRQELAHYLQESRGVHCDWQQIAITSGSQQALFLLSQLLLKPNDSVAIEDPGYLGVRSAFGHQEVTVLTMRVDEHGAAPSEKLGRPKLIYTTPSRQFPTGACMPIARRLAILKLVQQSGAWLVEDDYDSEFRYSRPPLPSLHSLADSTSVIYLGTMSKVLCPTLRIGYVVLPADLVEPFERLRCLVDDQGPLIDQATLASFISSGDFYSHIRKCRKTYGARLEAFIEAAKKTDLPLSFPFSDGGMNQAGFFASDSVDDQRISTALTEHGFDIPAISAYAAKKISTSGLLFGFTAFDEKTIEKNMQHLAPAILAAMQYRK